MLLIVCEEPNCNQIILRWQADGKVKQPPALDLFTHHFCNEHIRINKKAYQKANNWRIQQLKRLEIEFNEQYKLIKQELIGESG
jgi:hypothetical protein